MKYIPLIWAALRRKPIQAVLTLLSVMVAFILFGLAIGLNATFAHIAEAARPDRLNIGARFGGTLPLAMRDRILRVPNVKNIGGFGYVAGYYQDPKVPVGVFMLDDRMPGIWTELPLTPQQYEVLHARRTGIFVSKRMAERLHHKAGERLPLNTRQSWRKDGANLWLFDILGVVEDVPDKFPGGFMVGNYAYYSEPLTPQHQDTVLQYIALVKDETRATETSREIDRTFANSGTPTRSTPEKIAAQSAGRSAIDIAFVTQAVAGAGLFMILFLCGNGIAQSVRERIPEFAVLKTVGFSDAGVMAIVFAEAAIPCLCGAALGLGTAKLLIIPLTRNIMPPGFPLPLLSASVLGLGICGAIFVAFASAVIPALRVKQLDIAAALSGR